MGFLLDLLIRIAGRPVTAHAMASRLILAFRNYRSSHPELPEDKFDRVPAYLEILCREIKVHPDEAIVWADTTRDGLLSDLAIAVYWSIIAPGTRERQLSLIPRQLTERERKQVRRDLVTLLRTFEEMAPEEISPKFRQGIGNYNDQLELS